MLGISSLDTEHGESLPPPLTITLPTFSLLIILFSLAGIPPLAGFFAKFYIFMAVIEAKMYVFAIIGLSLIHI